jgi:hypothetical protein
MSNRLVRSLVSFEYLEQLMQLPDDVKVAKVYEQTEHVHSPRSFWIMFSGERFEPLCEGEMVPNIVPTIYTSEQGIEWKWEE